MGKTNDVPDAWEDDWEAQADKAEANPAPASQTTPKLKKSERLAQHVETNRKLWESAETPQNFHYLEATNNLPANTTTFRPQIKVLSRKPILAKRDPSSGAQTPADEDEEDDEAKKRAQLTPEQIRAKQKRDLEEKQRRYDEARAKIFGESAPSSGASTPGTVTPPRGAEGAHHSPRGRGRGRGGRGNNGSNTPNIGGVNDSRRQNVSQQIPGNRELYDPNYAQRRPEDGPARMVGGAAKDEQAPIRAPRGPDGTGRGGFGFARGLGRGT
ncbi:hypothetical protein NLU13_3832 [Sarocladium strictum]|uniref:SUZ domain-containing protein n=1 Tax=Sarocladium strictum TaxID=5046 RepID=A0AA39L7N3_SARSR|nr:hypothetical protein NLU13_3832 [Sarocladium strictum]